jgi:hypothetical protein
MQMKSVDHGPCFGSALFLGASSLLGVRPRGPRSTPRRRRRETVIGDGESGLPGFGRWAVIGDGQHHPASSIQPTAHRPLGPRTVTSRSSQQAASSKQAAARGKGREGKGEGGKGRFLSWQWLAWYGMVGGRRGRGKRHGWMDGWMDDGDGGREEGVGEDDSCFPGCRFVTFAHFVASSPSVPLP